MQTINKCFALLLCMTSMVVSSQQIITDRPDQTESSSVVPFKSLQIEAGALFQRSNGLQTNAYPSILWRYGVTKNFELRLLTQFESNKIINTSLKNSGLSDLQIGAKVQLYKKANTATEVAFLSHMILPTAKNSLTNDKIGFINKLAISHSFSDRIGLGYNIGYDYFGAGKGNLTYSIAVGFSLSKTISFYVEPYGEFSEFDNHFSNFDTGITYSVHDKLQLDISYGTGLNHSMKYFSTGFSWRIDM